MLKRKLSTGDFKIGPNLVKKSIEKKKSEKHVEMLFEEPGKGVLPQFWVGTCND